MYWGVNDDKEHQFVKYYSQTKRLIVIHHIHKLKNPLIHIKTGDLLFFDDCLYSQYVFLKNNIDMLYNLGVGCVLGLSPKAIRSELDSGIKDIESDTLHKQMNEQIKIYTDTICGEYINGFMSLKEINEILKYKNVFIALHGCCHLKLENVKSKIEQSKIFLNDLDDGIRLMKEYNLITNIYVYPYAYEPCISQIYLKKRGFKYIFAGNNSKRIPIESLDYEF